MAIALSLLVLTTIALVAGAILFIRRGRRTQAWLMLVLAAVMALNLAIWTVPTRSGNTLVRGTPVE